MWKWNGNETEILSRAIDETGYIQPTLHQLIEARGKDMGGYHLNPVIAWVIKKMAGFYSNQRNGNNV